MYDVVDCIELTSVDASYAAAVPAAVSIAVATPSTQRPRRIDLPLGRPLIIPSPPAQARPPQFKFTDDRSRFGPLNPPLEVRDANPPNGGLAAARPTRARRGSRRAPSPRSARRPS